jgi:hypothetical protein
MENFFNWARGKQYIERLDRNDLKGECVSLIARYLQEAFFPADQKNKALFLDNGGGTAASVAKQFPQYFESLTNSGLPQRGAVISFPDLAPPSGHVAIVMESRLVNGQRQVKIMDSNSPAGRIVKEHTYWINIPDGSANGYGSNIVWTNPKNTNSVTPPVQGGNGKLPNWQGGNEQATVQAIIEEAQRQGITSKDQIAYILATAQHETASSFEPVREAYYLGEPQAENFRKTLQYYPFYGRGYVQLTWKGNYQKYSDLLGIDMVNSPDLVMRPDIALFILIDGMKRGVFTTLKLDDFISDNNVDFFNARKIVNSLDQADLIARSAVSWKTKLG